MSNFIQTVKKHRNYWLWPLLALVVILAVLFLVPGEIENAPFQYQMH